MFQITLPDGRPMMGSRDMNEPEALHAAIQHVTETGDDVTVEFGDPSSDIGMHEVWRVQADTKIDDNDPTFPAIVHIGALQRVAL